MKKLIPIFVGCFALIVVTISLTFAWYTERKETVEVIDANTSGISFAYTIDEGEVLNQQTYEINNLSFFDIDNNNELSYFDSMALKIEIKLTNTSNKAITLTVNQAEPTHVTEGAQDSYTSDAYVQCLFNTSNSLAITGLSNINDLITESNMSLIEDLEAYGATIVGDTTTINSNCQCIFYIYVFGVQLVDSATNDFLSQKYNFTINFSAEVKA